MKRTMFPPKICELFSVCRTAAKKRMKERKNPPKAPQKSKTALHKCLSVIDLETSK